MHNMSDEYYSRLLTAAREKKDVKAIKEIQNNRVLVVLNNGIEGWIDWEEIFDSKEIT